MKDYSNIGHNTYYLGIVENIQACNRIRLYYSKEVPISLSNLKKVFDDNYSSDISGSDPIYEKQEGDYFSVPTKDGKIKFNTIIYYSNVTGEPIGFTIFNHLQETEIDGNNSKILEIRIFIKFTVEEDILQSDIKILNTLSSLSEIEDDRVVSDITKKLLDSTLSYNYSTVSGVINYFENTKDRSYRKYTSFLGDLYSDSHYGTLTDANMILGGSDYKRYLFQLVSGQNLNDYNTSFTRFFVGNYKKDIVLYQWSSENLEYRVVSLTNSNSFGIPKTIIPLGKVNKDPGNFSLEYMASKYAIFSNQSAETWAIYDLLEQSFRELPQGTGVSIDPWDEFGQVTFFSRDLGTRLLDQFPRGSGLYKELLSLPLDLKTPALQFLGKVGNWIKLRGYSEQGNPVIYSNTNGNILVSPEESILPISNRCILSQKIGKDSTDYEFYFVEKGKTVFSKSYEELSGLSDDPENEDYKIVFNSVEDLENLERISLIDGLRRRPILSYDLPKNGFLSSYAGILFYEIDNKINYL